MGRSCAVIPKVLNDKGQTVDSKLFEDLLSFSGDNREDAVRIYKITKGQKFIQNWNPKLELDKNGEPTIRSLLRKTNLSTYITDSKVLKKLNRDIGYYERGKDEVALVIKNPKNYKKLTDKARKFNKESEFRDNYVAKVISTLDSRSNKVLIGIEVEKRNRVNSAEADRMEYNESLNERLRDILKEHGVAIGTLTALEERLGINGVTDFDQARTVGEGLIEFIKLAKGIRGERALPEEFAHWAIEAMGSDNPLINRLINLIASKGLDKEIIGEDYDKYSSLYNNDEVKLAKEAAGKLLAKHLLNNESIPEKPYKTLLGRVISAIKNFVKGLSASSIQKAMMRADKSFGSLAKDILEGRMDEVLDNNKISESGLFYNTTGRIARDRGLLQDIITNEVKRLKIYAARTNNITFNINQEQLINRLKKALATNNEIDGIYSFAEHALNILMTLDRRLSTMLDTPGVTTNEKAKLLRDIRNYLYSYSHIAKDIKDALIDEERFQDNRYGDRVRVVMDSLTTLLDDLFTKYNKVSMPLFVDFIRPFLGNDLVIPFGKFKGQRIDDFIKQKEDGSYKLILNKDISFFDRWLDSMADSSDYILKAMDQALKKSKENSRLRTLKTMKEIQAAGIKLEQAGIKDTDWMFEEDDEGNITGNYIQEINIGLYKKKRSEMYNRLKMKYGKNPVGEDLEAYKKERNQWYNDNTEYDRSRQSYVPKKSIYKNKVYENLNDAQREYYETVMGIKEKLDSYLPNGYTSLNNTIKIRKDLIERVKRSEDVASGAKQIWESVKDLFIRRSDDTEFGDRATLKDFEGKEVQVLPIYYTKLRKGEKLEDISRDVTSTLIAYAAMATDFDEMNKVIDLLELSRDVLKDNLKIVKTRDSKPLKEKLNIAGEIIESKLFKSNDELRVIQRLNDFFEMQVYQRYIADEGVFGDSKIDKAKVADFINRMTALNSLALNVLSGISNVATGSTMMRIESIAKEFFTEMDTLNADKIYAKEMPSFLGEIGKRVKISKIALWNELFDVMQEFDAKVKETDFDRKTWFSRSFNSSSLFFMNNAGEHWMQTRTSLALAMAYKMKDKEGNIVNLWDAMEIVYIDPNNKALGAKLKVKEGYTKADGTAFTEDDIRKFTRKSAAINQRMHGIYNRIDRNAFQKIAIGRMAMMYRKWIRPSLNRRYRGATKNFDLDTWTEGYYYTMWRFTKQLVKELKEGQFTLASSWKNLTKTEKANIRRAITEVGHFLLIACILGFISWDDDDNKMIEYQLRRLYTEIGAMSPTPFIFDEGLRIVKSPAAGVNTLESTIDLFGLLNPYNYETFVGEESLLKSGRYKGESKATKIIFESPLVPMNRTVYRGLHPEEGIPFFKQ